MVSKRKKLSACFVLLLAAATAAGQATQERQHEFAEHMQKAEGYLRQKQPMNAIPEFQAALAIDATDVNAQGNLGVLLFFQGKLDESIPHFRAALAGKPDLVKIREFLGLAELRTLDSADGIKDLETVFPLIPDEKIKVQVGLELITFYTQTADLEDSARILAELRKTDPNNPEVLYAAYRTYTDLAGESMLAIAIHAPDSAQLHQVLAHEETREGKTNAAIEEYRKAIEINPQLPGVHFELAELLSTSQDSAMKKEAEKEYQAAYKENPDDAKLLCRLGELDAQQGNLEKAREKFSRAMELQPGDADAKLGLGKTLIDLGKGDQALPLLEQTVQEDPTNAIAHYRLAMLFRKQGRIEDAKREVEIYKKLKDLKDKLRTQYKNLLIVPNEIRADDPDEK